MADNKDGRRSRTVQAQPHRACGDLRQREGQAQSCHGQRDRDHMRALHCDATPEQEPGEGAWRSVAKRMKQAVGPPASS
jgi:hypothetical protein